MLKVSEVFGKTIQGEGKNAGMECSFLRLSFCQLACSFCDTPYTWNWKGTKFAHPDKYDINAEMHLMSTDDVLAKLRAIGVKAVVISGGEPMLQQKGLIPVLRVLKDEGYWVEVETNGCIPLRPEFEELVDQINCSPKLSNSGMSKDKREQPDALRNLVASDKTNFKFVIDVPQDAREVITLVKTYKMKEVRLMPLCTTVEELLEREHWLKPMCEQLGFIYCTRLSILNGNKRGT